MLNGKVSYSTVKQLTVENRHLSNVALLSALQAGMMDSSILCVARTRQKKKISREYTHGYCRQENSLRAENANVDMSPKSTLKLQKEDDN